MNDKPELLIIAGPNGAGKTTFANTYLPEFTKVREFVNADLIAKGISPFAPERALIEAGRILLDRVHHLINDRMTFALESTLSGRSYLDLLLKSKANGYTIAIYYIYLDSVELSMNRIAERVQRGGHDVPEDIVSRRYKRSLSNFINGYLQLADRWRLYDNSSTEYKLIAMETNGEKTVTDATLYNVLLKRYGI